MGCSGQSESSRPLRRRSGLKKSQWQQLGMSTPEVKVRQATVEDLDLVVPLFDAYRQFYRQPSDTERARRFLLDRFEHN